MELKYRMEFTLEELMILEGLTFENYDAPYELWVAIRDKIREVNVEEQSK